MKANELRIGNLVERKETGEVITILAILPSTVRTNRGTLPYNCLQPILLTEERLLKFGFIATGEQYSLEGISIEDIHNGEKWCVYMFDEYHAVECPLAIVQYLHQLQNLYFALTGEELTILS